MVDPKRAAKRLFLCVFGIMWLGCSMSISRLMASAQRPYVHEIFGSELLLSWPDGQKLHEEVAELYYAGDYTSALQKLDKAIADATQLSKSREKDTAILLTTKAEGVTVLGDTDEANTLLVRAQELADRVLSTKDPATARIQSDRASVFFIRGNRTQAKVALERAITTQAERSSTNGLALARSLNLQALMCLAEGDPAQASALLRRSSEIIVNAVGTQNLFYGQKEWVESLIVAARGEYEQSIRLCESSLTILTNCFGAEHLVLVAVRRTLADDYQQLGMYEQAAPLLRDNVRTLEKSIGTDNIIVSAALSSLGLLHYRLGNHSDAERLFRRCLSIQEKSIGTSSPVYAGTVNNLALVLDASGKNAEVSTLFNSASLALEKSLGKSSPDLATVLLNWGSFSRNHGRTDIANRLISEAFAIRDKAFGKDHPAIAEAAEEYARLECDLGNFEHAMHLGSLAICIKTNYFGHDHPAMADSFNLAARIYAGTGDEYKAAEFYAKSAEIRTRVFGMSHPTVASELEAAGLALCRPGEYGAAAQPLLMALQSQRDYLVEQVARRANGEDGLRLAGKGFYRTELLHSLCALHISNTNNAVSVEGAEQLASCKALLEEVQATQLSLESDARTSTRELREKLDVIQSQLARLPDNNLNPTQRDARRRQLQTAKMQNEEALAAWNGLVAQTIRERSLTLSEIARSLPRQSVLVDFIEYERYDFAAKTNQWKEQRYAAYLTFPLAQDSTNLVVQRVDLGEGTPINEAVELVCKRMSAGQFAAKDLAPTLARLSELVYAPLSRHLTNVSQLIVCPDGQLSRLPFEMLPVGNKFLIEEKTISYVTSGREVLRVAANRANSRAKTQSSKSLVVGNPDFDLDLGGGPNLVAVADASLSINPTKRDASAPAGGLAAPQHSEGGTPALRSLSRDYRGLKFKPLPGAEAEARGVAALLGEDAELRLGAEARESELKAVKSPRVLHLATHGFFLTDQEFKQTNSIPWNSGFTRIRSPGGGTANEWENPMVRCGLALAGANRAQQVTNAIAEDGLLTGLEASLLDLQGTELVILSACDSGTGEVKIGEGVMSLRRAFRIAGAETVLASHWPVNDRATSRLMTEFMRRWRTGEPRAQAWREAQLTLLHSKGAPEDFSNPFFWSAFTLTGQWD